MLYKSVKELVAGDVFSLSLENFVNATFLFYGSLPVGGFPVFHVELSVAFLELDGRIPAKLTLADDRKVLVFRNDFDTNAHVNQLGYALSF